jgi:hypothetical protein
MKIACLAFGGINPGNVVFYNQANAVFYTFQNNNSPDPMVWIYVNNYESQNLFFSRIVPTTYDQLIFNGIKVTWP